MRFRSTRVRVRVRVKCRSVCFISTRVSVMSRTIVRGYAKPLARYANEITKISKNPW